MKQKYSIDRSKFMSQEEAKRLLKTSEEHAQLDLLLGRGTWVTRSMLVSLSLRSGLRVGEIAALKVADIHINKAESYLTVQKGKGGKRRDVYINAELSKHLKSYLTIKKQSWNHPTGPDDYLFSHGRANKRYTTTAMHLSFKVALRKAGIAGHTIHHARHTYATLLLGATSDLQAVRRQLGHSSIVMTSLYADCLPEHRQAAADKLSI